MTHTSFFQTELWLKQPLEEIWEFHKNPENLLKISPDFLKLSLSDVPEKMGKGASFKIVTQNKLFKPFFHWNVEYLEWGEEENFKYFVDQQKEGPFEIWKHRHEFKRGALDLVVSEKEFHPKNSGTWIVDKVEYSLKPQFKNFNWVAEKMLTQLFVFRKRRLERLFKRTSIS